MDTLHQWKYSEKRKMDYTEKPVPVPLFLPQIAILFILHKQHIVPAVTTFCFDCRMLQTPFIERQIKSLYTCQYNETNVMQFLFNLLRIKAYTCFEHYLLILSRRYTSGTWYIACVLCQLAAPGLKFAAS
jgi:hypothetical protein